MNTAIIFAGGTGQRMNTKSKPKQFLDVHGRPVIIYTLEIFQNHPLVDGIILVCLESWMDYAKELIQRFGITKVKAIVKGGETGQGSIFNGIKKAYEMYPPDTTLLIHDGVRPLINGGTITDCINSVKIHGNAITVSPATETIFLKEKGSTKVGNIFNRAVCEMAKAPQCFILNDIYQGHLKAQKDGLMNFIDSASLMQHYGCELYTVEGPSENIKITTPSDFYIFKSILDAKESLQILEL